jgi:hypothetical protein
VPEVYVGIGKRYSHEASVPLFSQGSDHAIDGLGRMLVENFDGLARDQWGIHEKKSPVGTDNIRGRLQIYCFAFRQPTLNR